MFEDEDLNLILSMPNSEPQSPCPHESFGSCSGLHKVELRPNKGVLHAASGENGAAPPLGNAL